MRDMLVKKSFPTKNSRVVYDTVLHSIELTASTKVVLYGKTFLKKTLSSNSCIATVGRYST